jgi:hypothetical protein
MIPFSCGFECDPAKLMSRLNIQPHDLQATWAQAHKDPSFGVPLFDMPEFFKPSRWRAAFNDVQQGIKETKQVHAASQKLGTMVFETVSNLGESNELEDIQSAILPLLHQIHEEAKTDAGVRMLCSTLKTDAIAKIFPPAAMDTLTSFYGASTQSVHASIEESPPPPMDGVDVTDQTFEFAKEAKLEHARAAFGAVMGTSEERRQWVRRRRRSTAFGGFADAVSWLRDSVLSTIQRVWKHVGRFALVAVMVAAVILTYCAIMGRDYESDYAFVENVDESKKPTGTFTSISHENLAYASFGVVEPISFTIAGVFWGTLTVLGALGFTFALYQDTDLANMTSGADYLQKKPDYVRKPRAHSYSDQELLDKSLSTRAYKSSMCSMVWKCLDSVVKLMNSSGSTKLARAVDSFFQSRVATADQQLLVQNAHQKVLAASMKLASERTGANLKGYLGWTEATGREYGRKHTELVGSEAYKSTESDLVARGAIHGLDDKTKKWKMLNMKDIAGNFRHRNQDILTATSSKDTFEANTRFPQQLECMNEWLAIRNAELNPEQKNKLKFDLLNERQDDILTFISVTSDTVRKEQQVAQKAATAGGPTLVEYIDKLFDADKDNLHAEIPKAMRLVRTQAVGFGKNLGAMANVPGLSFIGDALGINAFASEQNKNKGAAILAGIFLAWYLMGPVFASLLIVVAAAGFFASSQGMSATQAFGISCTIFVGLFHLVPDVTSDQAATINALLQISAQTSADIRQFRVQNAHEQYAQASARAAADAARHGAFASVAAGAAAGIFTGGNTAAMSAAASAGSNLVSGLSRHREIEAQQRLYDQTRNFFGEFV